MSKWEIQLSSIKSLLFLLLENGWILAAGISSNFNALRKKVTLRFVSFKQSLVDIIKILTDECD